MRLTVTFIVSALCLLSSASPVQQKSRGRKIPLSKRNNFLGPNGVNLDSLRGHVAYANAKIHKGLSTFSQHRNPKSMIARSDLQNSTDTNDSDDVPDSTDNWRYEKRTAGTVPLVDDDNSLWHGTITIGNPPQEFSVDFDTGSSDLFLPSPLCLANCDQHRSYNPISSSTSKTINTPFKLGYGDGSEVSGIQYQDTITIAGMTAQNQTFGAAMTYSSGFSKAQFAPDGLLGMAFKSISECDADPVFQTLIAQNQTDEPVFAFKLGQEDSESELFLGGVNKALYTGDFSYANVTEEAYWKIPLDEVAVNGSSVVNNVHAIIDTGTTLVIGDQDSVKKLYDGIPGSKPASSSGDGLYTFPCNTTSPGVSLSFGGRVFEINTTFNLGPVTDGSQDCVGGIVASKDNDFWVVGDVFLRNVYTVFDVGQSRVGFATLA